MSKGFMIRRERDQDLVKKISMNMRREIIGIIEEDRDQMREIVMVIEKENVDDHRKQREGKRIKEDLLLHHHLLLNHHLHLKVTDRNHNNRKNLQT